MTSRTASGGVGGLTRRFSALKAGLGPVGLALGGLTGIVLGLGAVFSKAGAEANSILLTSARFGVSTEAFQRGVVFMRTFTQDTGMARKQFEGLLQTTQDFERVRFGQQIDPRRFTAAARLGINVSSLISGQIDELALLEKAFEGYSRLANQGLEAESRYQFELLLGP